MAKVRRLSPSLLDRRNDRLSRKTRLFGKISPDLRARLAARMVQRLRKRSVELRIAQAAKTSRHPLKTRAVLPADHDGHG